MAGVKVGLAVAVAVGVEIAAAWGYPRVRTRPGRSAGLADGQRRAGRSRRIGRGRPNRSPGWFPPGRGFASCRHSTRAVSAAERWNQVAGSGKPAGVGAINIEADRVRRDPSAIAAGVVGQDRIQDIRFTHAAAVDPLGIVERDGGKRDIENAAVVADRTSYEPGKVSAERGVIVKEASISKL